ncbi:MULTISPECIES: hypothetical protein [unclassified Sphingopyxis]|jgi:hypothetical protein|uniref:hypothetical protein n=1 Tax=unclassified Sphingopyxis TaxID=2614943 RepID=UPI002855F361|nr:MULTISPECIES: hypothetical protein [unclassified Sphingopyxis]MDR6833223.1 hypothetical protein [Sphingopyxis sp. BE122]MDR7225492.1 hypothetical protein [Sphingopyxis sp. BE259]
MRPTLAALTLITLAACGAPGGAAAADDDEMVPVAATVSAAPTAPAPTAPDETDAIMLAAAGSACKAEDYKAFFDAMIASVAVRRTYSAAKIDVVRYDAARTPYTAIETKKIAASDYSDFPIKMVDHYRQSVVPARPGDTDEHVILQFNQSQSNQISVEWTRVHYDGKSEGGDDLGQAVDLDGQPYDAGGRVDGQLLLYPTETCWQLVADNRYERP